LTLDLGLEIFGSGIREKNGPDPQGWKNWQGPPFPRLELSNPIMAGSRDPILLKSNRTYLIGNLLRPL
jgi:hypothetical protein